VAVPEEGVQRVELARVSHPLSAAPPECGLTRRPAWLDRVRWPAGLGRGSGSGPVRWPAWLFAGLVALYLVPFWAARYVPTIDGPSHLYNAWVLGQLASSTPAPLLREYFMINRAPVPNWLSHVVLAALLRALPPVVAEKALLSGYVLLMTGALWYLAGSVERRRAWLALLGLPFVWSLPLQLGFYNFCISIGFFLLVIACWWRHRARPGWRFAVILNLLLLLCYFAHIVSAVVALAGIAVLWLASLRRERWRGHLAHLAIVAPATALPIWYLLARAGGARRPSHDSWRALWRPLVELHWLVAFNDEAGWTAKILGAGITAWVLFTLLRESIAWRGAVEGRVASAPGSRAGGGVGEGGPAVAGGAGQDGAAGWAGGGDRAGIRAVAWRPRLRLREEDGFLALALVLALIYFVSPEGAAGGSLLKPRLMLYPFLVVIPWLSVRLGRWGRTAAILVLALLAARPALYAVTCYRAGGRQVERFLRGLDAVSPDSVVVALIFFHDAAPCLRTAPFNHAIGYAAIAKRLVDWDDYEATTDYFPLRFRPEANHTELGIEADPKSLRVRQLQSRVDAIYCWRMPPAWSISERLERNCRLIGAGPDWRLYDATKPPR
jgi:hypothetical protein